MGKNAIDGDIHHGNGIDLRFMDVSFSETTIA